jgi:hypothetical protein
VLRKARRTTGRVVEEQNLPGTEPERANDCIVGFDGAVCSGLVIARVEDGGDGPWKLIAVILTCDDHFVVHAAEPIWAGLVFKSFAHVQHGLKFVWWVQLAVGASQAPTP